MHQDDFLAGWFSRVCHLVITSFHQCNILFLIIIVCLFLDLETFVKIASFLQYFMILSMLIQAKNRISLSTEGGPEELCPRQVSNYKSL